MRFLIISIATCLVGCATQQLNAGLQKVIGMPIDVLVSDWGYPSAQREIMGHTLYIWSNDAGVMAVPLYGGGMYAGRLACTVQVAVNDEKIITSYQWNGNNGGCAQFARRIAH
jgi:hypothetical protein